MNNNNNPIQHQNQSLFHTPELTQADPRLLQGGGQRSSLRDIYSSRRSKTIADGENYSPSILNNYNDDAFLPQQQFHLDNELIPNVYGNKLQNHPFKRMFKATSSQNSGSMTSLMSGLNSPLLSSNSSASHNHRQNRTTLSQINSNNHILNTPATSDHSGTDVTHQQKNLSQYLESHLTNQSLMQPSIASTATPKYISKDAKGKERETAFPDRIRKCSSLFKI